MKIKNKRLYSTDQDHLLVLKQEYLDMGFDVELTAGVLTVFTKRRKKPKVKDDKKGKKSARR